MISIELLTKHMAWANQEIYREIKKLDPEVLDYYVIDKEWTVRIIRFILLLLHIYIVKGCKKNHFLKLNSIWIVQI